MGISAAGYVLLVPGNRRRVLLDAAELGDSHYPSESVVAEPVPYFRHSNRAPLVVFASFKANYITHVAEGKRGHSAGTELTRLNLLELTTLTRPIQFDNLSIGVDARIRHHLERILAEGGILPPKTFQAFVDRIVELDEGLSDRLARFSARRLEALTDLSTLARTNLALQKEALGLALEIAGLPKDELLAWQPKDDEPRSFLEGFRDVRVREDTMLLKDFSTLPGFDAVGEVTHYGTKKFESPDDHSIRLTIIMANRTPLEEQTGADLIYFNEAYQCFVMVQYKAMEQGTNGAEFRWRGGDQFMQEVQRMEEVLYNISKIQSGRSPKGFRFSENPFFLKFCPRVQFNPDDSGLFKGIYLPLDLWKRLEGSGQLRGPNGGNLLSFRNVGRRLNNSEFVKLVGGSWVGTSIEQSAVLCELIHEVVDAGRTVTFAFEHVDVEENPGGKASERAKEEEDWISLDQ